ncbi:MAG: FKBP-type peptidyl-prolyl cis-trans isomerase [Candidatus Micrarchaeia archaeon]
MSFNDGDFLKIDYTMWDAATNEIIYTTNKDVAKKANIYDDKIVYNQSVVILGSNNIIKGLNDALKNMKENETKKIELEPKDAFGERNESLVYVVPLSKLKSQNINPYPGMSVDVDNTRMIVKSVNSGRVVLDANHPLAGKKLIYEVTLVKQLKTINEKIEGIAEMYNIKPSKIEVNNSNAVISFNDSVSKNADYFVAKAEMIAGIFTYLKEISKVEVKEEYLKPNLQTQAEPKTKK